MDKVFIHILNKYIRGGEFMEKRNFKVINDYGDMTEEEWLKMASIRVENLFQKWGKRLVEFGQDVEEDKKST